MSDKVFLLNEKVKSMIRHVLTGLGVVLALVGLNKLVPVLDFLLVNLDGVYAAVSTVIGFVLALVGFFRNKERFARGASSE